MRRDPVVRDAKLNREKEEMERGAELLTPERGGKVKELEEAGGRGELGKLGN